MPELDKSFRSPFPLTIQETTEDESDVLFRVRNLAGNTVFSVDNAGGNSSEADGAFRVGPATLGWQDEVAAASLANIHRTHGTASENEFSLVVRAISPDYSPTGTVAKGGILSMVRTEADGSGANLPDAIGGYFQSYTQGTTAGRSFGIAAEARHVSAEVDGLLFGAELGVFNEGTVVTNPDNEKAKVGLWLRSAGANKATAAIAFAANAAKWHYGIFMREFLTGIRLQNPGEAGAVGIDMTNHANWGEAIRLPNAKPLRSYLADAVTTRDLLQMNSSDQIVFGNSSDPISIPSATNKADPRLTLSFISFNPISAGQRKGVMATGTASGMGAVTDQLRVFDALAQDNSNVVSKSITGAVNNGAGLIRITATAHGLVTDEKVSIFGVVGTTEANANWTITVIDANTFDLQGSTFANAYVSGGTVRNTPYLAAYLARVAPRVARNVAGSMVGHPGLHGDDVVAFAAQNTSGIADAIATDAFYVAASPSITAAAWYTAFNSDAKLSLGAFRFSSDLTGAAATGAAIFNAGLATVSGGGYAVLVPNNAVYGARNAAGNAYVDMFKLTTANRIAFLTVLQLVDGVNVVLGSSVGTIIGSTTSEKLGFFGKSAVTQRTFIAAPAGGATIDAEARTAINSIRQVLIDLGFKAAA